MLIFLPELFLVNLVSVLKSCRNLQNPLYRHQDPGATQRQICGVQDKEGR